VSPILDVQRTHADVFRLRLGIRTPAANGKTKPTALDGAIRVTSPAHDAVQAFADVYGGDVEPWARDDGCSEWQAILPTDALPIVLLPGQALVQWWETWDSGGCVRRCDGQWQVAEVGKTSRPCACPSTPAERMADLRACKPTSQLMVVCPEVAIAGAGRLVTRGLIAAGQLPSVVTIAEGMLARGYRVPAILRIVAHKGRRTYVVPQVELIGVSLHQLDSGTPSGAIGPVSAQRTEPSVPALTEGRPALGSPPAPPPPDCAPVEPVPDPGRPFADEDETLLPAERQRSFAVTVDQWAAAKWGKAANAKTKDAVRHAIVAHTTNGRTSSYRAVRKDELRALMVTFGRLRDGSLEADIDDNGAVVLVAVPATETGRDGQ